MSNLLELLRSAEKAVAMADWPEATKRYGRVLEVAEHPDALLHLSYSELNAGRYRQARQFALRAAAAGPKTRASVLRLLSRLRTFNESGAVHRFVRQSPFLRQMDPSVLMAVAAQLSYIGEHLEALQFMDKAIALQRGMPLPLLARAQVNIFLGRFEAAEQDIMACLRLAPYLASAWWSLAWLRRQDAASHHVDALRTAIARGSRNAADQAHFHYALHKELDNLGHYREAAQALDIACKAARAPLDYSDARNRALFRQIKALPIGGASQARAESAAAGVTPIFIVGMYRSGTTLLERLLGGNPQVRNAGELQDLTACMRNATDHYCFGPIDEVIVARSAQADFSQVGQQYLDGVRWRLHGQTHITDKWPPNHLTVGFICQALPDAKIIHMIRDPVETCFSNLREMFGGAAAYSYDQAELASYHLQYQQLMRHWHERFPGRILDVEYSHLTTDTERVMRQVAAFCGLAFVPGMLDPRTATGSVATASAVQVRGPVAAAGKPKWETYRDYLQPLIAALQA